jgi:hypothetical protein
MHEMQTATDFALARTGPTTYQLTGTVTTRTDGWTIEAGVISDGIVPDPKIVRFFLSAASPDGDAADVVTPHPIDETFEDSAELESAVVHLHNVHTLDGDNEITVPLTEASSSAS